MNNDNKDGTLANYVVLITGDVSFTPKDVKGQFSRKIYVPSADVAEYSYESNTVLHASQLATSKVALSPPVISKRGKEASLPSMRRREGGRHETRGWRRREAVG